jgi:hypothetical protein
VAALRPWLHDVTCYVARAHLRRLLPAAESGGGSGLSRHRAESPVTGGRSQRILDTLCAARFGGNGRPSSGCLCEMNQYTGFCVDGPGCIPAADETIIGRLACVSNCPLGITGVMLSRPARLYTACGQTGAGEPWRRLSCPPTFLPASCVWSERKGTRTWPSLAGQLELGVARRSGCTCTAVLQSRSVLTDCVGPARVIRNACVRNVWRRHQRER